MVGVMIDVVVIGLGYFSQFHLASWCDMPETRVVAATDLDAARREWAHAEFGVPVVDSVGTALAANPQVVDIVAPPPAHADLIRAALAPGRVIICQKPFCTSLAEAQTMIGFAPWLAIFPGLAIMLLVLGFGLAGDGLNDRLDPRFRRERQS